MGFWGFLVPGCFSCILVGVGFSGLGGLLLLFLVGLLILGVGLSGRYSWFGVESDCFRAGGW